MANPVLSEREEEQKKRDAAAPVSPMNQYPGQPGNSPEPLR